MNSQQQDNSLKLLKAASQDQKPILLKIEEDSFSPLQDRGQIVKIQKLDLNQEILEAGVKTDYRGYILEFFQDMDMQPNLKLKTFAYYNYVENILKIGEVSNKVTIFEYFNKFIKHLNSNRGFSLPLVNLSRYCQKDPSKDFKRIKQKSSQSVQNLEHIIEQNKKLIQHLQETIRQGDLILKVLLPL